MQNHTFGNAIEHQNLFEKEIGHLGRNKLFAKGESVLSWKIDQPLP